jgi:phage-related protein
MTPFLLGLDSIAGELQTFPERVQDAFGYDLYQIQLGRSPSDWKPMSSIGQGVSEIRKRDTTGAYRIIYIAKFDEAIYVLHSFQKKSQKTEQLHLDIAKTRLKLLLQERSSQ